MNSISKQFIHGGNIYRYGKDARTRLLDFSANINPLGPSPRGIAALQNWDKLICHYPEPYQTTLRQNLGQYYNLDIENIAVGNGATEFLYTLFSHLRPSRIWVTAPTFSEYARAGIASGSQIISLPQDELMTEAQKKMKSNEVVCLCQPNNPDGKMLSQECVGRWLELTEQRGAYVLMDESFSDFAPHFMSYRHYVKENRRLFVLQSLTKFWSIPGLRLGALFAYSDWIRLLLAGMDQWNVNVLAARYMTEALWDTEYILSTQHLVQTEKERIYQKYSQIEGLSVIRPIVNFMLMELPSQITSKMLCDHLAKRDILIRNCDNYDGLGERHIRIAIRCPEENDYLFSTISEELRNII